MRTTAKKFSPWLMAAYWIVLFTATHVPVPAGPPHSDKFLHISAYFVLSVLFACVLFTRGFDKWRLNKIVVIVLFIYAVVDELTQELVNRVCDPMDAAADAVGVLLGLWFFHAIAKRLFVTTSATVDHVE